ncbi:MAG: nucleotide sugar dehydrogenase [Gammaproteobacteria bacterium]|nr:nucleotide sugar dehydrogenase [Gammaproteobacteria bacterium]
MSIKIGIIGLGYVGLQLAVALGRRYHTIGYDLSQAKISDYRQGIDITGEVSREQFIQASQLSFAGSPQELAQLDVYIIAVPTPVDASNRPDLSPLVSASKMVGAQIAKGAIVVYESTVFPGATEDICVPELEKASGLKWLEDFNVGYSPERINPGDKEHTLEKIVKVVAGDTESVLDQLAEIYGSVVEAGVHRASSIRVAEAAKVIENTQRDLNIAFVNELAVLFDRLDIDTNEVLDAAETKWNFLKFRPGLVGGHCIGVDPYYLTDKAQSVGYLPEVILAGRRINGSMGKFIAEKTIKGILSSAETVSREVIICGLTFKENCPDLRNSQVMTIITELQDFGFDVSVHDPVASREEALNEYQIKLKSWDELPRAAALILAVPHEELEKRPIEAYAKKIIPQGLFVDVKGIRNKDEINQAELQYWSL